MDSTTILSISSPERLFTRDAIKSEFRKFAMKWHPDHCKDPDCDRVFAHINKLYNSGLEKISKGYWNTFGLLEVTSVEGKRYNIRYKVSTPFDLGIMYVGDTVVAYKVKKEFKKLFDSFVDRVGKLRYASDRMKNEFSRYMPVIKANITTTDDLILVLSKTPDVLPLSVLLKYFGGAIEPKSAAWIISTLHNIHCFLQYNNLVHNNIDLDTYFVSPKNHSGLLLGGWWYTVGVGEKLKSVPAKTFGMMTNDKCVKKEADPLVDGELIRSLARKILGDESGNTLMSKFNVPAEMSMWVRFPGDKKAVNDYKNWNNIILPVSFGERKFTPMDVNIEKAYERFMA